MNERIQLESNHQQPASNAGRYQRFEAIWNETEGSALEKTLATLGTYSSYQNWGTYAGAVRGVIGPYCGSGGYVEISKEGYNLYSDIRFLLLQLSEKIPFHAIKQDGDLAAIFHVIYNCTNINAYDFDQDTGLYLAYDKFKSEIKKSAACVGSWAEMIRVLARASGECCDPSLTNIFLKEKFINGYDSWKLITDTGTGTNMKGKAGLKALCERLEIYNNAVHFSEDELKKLFGVSLEREDYFFAQWIFFKKNNMEMKSFLYDQQMSLPIFFETLCGMINKNVDGELLLDIIQHESKSYNVNVSTSLKYKMVYIMVNALLDKRDFIDNWDDIKGKFNRQFKCMTEIHSVLGLALELSNVKMVAYFLKEKGFKTDTSRLVSRAMSDKQDVAYQGVSLLQSVILNMKNFTHADDPYKGCDLSGLVKCLEMINLLIECDPSCVKVKDYYGNDIFFHLDEVKKVLNAKESVPEEANKIFDEAYKAIRRPFIVNMYTFFSGKSENASNVNMLNQDIFQVLAKKTMQLM